MSFVMKKYSYISAAVIAVVVLLALIGIPVTPLDSTKSAQAAVPAVPTNSTVVNVKVGGDRNGGSSVAGLQGVVLHLQRSNSGNTAPTGVRADRVSGDDDGWARCVSDADGDCSFIVPNTNQGGANRTRLWVVQYSAPDGWFLNDEIRTGNADGTSSQRTPYRFLTPTLTSGSTVSSTQYYSPTFMLNTNSSTDTQNTRTASGGTWQVSRANPELPQSCGMDIALILDLSNSVSNNGDLESLKDQADILADALVGTPSRMALFSFGSYSPALSVTGYQQPNYPDLTTVATQSAANTFKQRYANWITPTLAGNTYAIYGGTNWDQGLYVPSLSAGTPDTPNHYDAAIVLADGNPSFYGPNPTSGQSSVNGSGSYTRIRELENAIFSANALKAKGTRILAVGVGQGIANDPDTEVNLKAISGAEKYNEAVNNVLTADYYQIPDVDTVGQALTDLVDQQCDSSLNVTKMLVPEDNAPGDLSGAQLAGGGWEFTASSDTAGLVDAPATRTTPNDGTSTVSYPLNFDGTSNAAVTVTETQQDGYSFVTAQCVVRDDSGDTTRTVTIDSDDLDNPGFTVNVAQGERVSCTVYNTAAEPEADITVNKNWIVNGVSYPNGAQPSELGAGPILSGPNGAQPTTQGWGTARGGYSVGDTADIGEAMFYGAMHRCDVVSATITAINGTDVNMTMPHDEGAFPSASQLTPITLTQEHNTVDVTNEVECTSTLTLVKEVQGGDADPTQWTLEAITPDGALPGPQGTSGSAEATAVVTPEVVYSLAESGGDPRYAQVDQRPRPLVNPESTGTWQCVLVNAAGTPVSGVVDGLNGGASVPLGQSMRCTAVNQTASLTLLKHVANPLAGGATAADWTLTATPLAGVNGLSTESVTGAETAVGNASTVNVRPGHLYTIAEDGPAGYTPTLQILTGSDPADEDAWEDATDADAETPGVQVSIAALENETYRLVNERELGSIAWNKTSSGSVSTENPSGNPLAGSVWQIVGPGHPADNPLIVEDSDNDGAFLVEDLDWGQYTVTEIQAPVGYELTDPAPSFTTTISGTNLHYVHNSPIDNPQREITLPTAGGSGSLPFLIGGAALLFLTLGGWFLYSRRTSH